MSNVQCRMSNEFVKRPNDPIGSVGNLVNFIRHSTWDIRHLTSRKMPNRSIPLGNSGSCKSAAAEQAVNGYGFARLEVFEAQRIDSVLKYRIATCHDRIFV